MTIGSIRDLTGQMEFQSIHLDYIVAISETKEGVGLVTKLIEVYTEHARQLISAASTCVREDNYRDFQFFLMKLRLGSERIGAFRLADRIHDMINGEEAMTPNKMKLVMATVTHELDKAKEELVVLERILFIAA